MSSILSDIEKIASDLQDSLSLFSELLTNFLIDILETIEDLFSCFEKSVHPAQPSSLPSVRAPFPPPGSTKDYGPKELTDKCDHDCDDCEHYEDERELTDE